MASGADLHQLITQPEMTYSSCFSITRSKKANLASQQGPAAHAQSCISIITCSSKNGVGSSHTGTEN